MVTRKLPANYEEPIYVEGFLHNLAMTQSELDYGYSSNHLPKTSGQSRSVESSFDLAKQSGSDN